MSSTNPTDYLSAIKKMDENFQSFIIIAIIFIVLMVFVGYLIYLNGLNQKNINFMNNLYSSIDGYIRPISTNDSDCSGNLYDYYVKTAYNSCSGGSYKNDFVDVEILKSVIKQGVRCLDFEIYSVDNKPVVSTSTSDSYYIKETFNSVDFADVMNVITNYAFSGGTCPNPTDPLIIHLRIKSTNQQIYSKMAEILKTYSSFMLGKEYSYENSGENLGGLPLLSFQNKIILVVDKSNNSYLENDDFLEYVNLTSNSVFMRGYTYYNVKNNPDVQELTEYNRKNMTIVFPDNGSNPVNSSGALCRAYGCQMVAMRYQYVDNFLLENDLFFDRATYAFSLKPEALRYKPVTIPEPTPQNPEYSYATRTSSTDYYSFNM
jgi:hypothetical protein